MGEEKKEKTWAWLMPSGKIFRVVSNPAEGRISVYDQDGTQVKKYDTLSEAAVSLIEKNFLGTVATVVRGKGTETEKESKKDMADDIAMYIR